VDRCIGIEKERERERESLECQALRAFDSRERVRFDLQIFVGYRFRLVAVYLQLINSALSASLAYR